MQTLGRDGNYKTGPNENDSDTDKTAFSSVVASLRTAPRSGVPAS